MAAAHVNSANLGIPVAVHVLHDTSFVAAALFQTLLITPLILVLIDLDVRRGARDRWARLLRLPLRNPIIAASAAGLAVSALGRPLPAAVSAPLQMLGGAAVPAALFALGMSLAARTRPDAHGRTERRVLVALKLGPVRPVMPGSRAPGDISRSAAGRASPRCRRSPTSPSYLPQLPLGVPPEVPPPRRPSRQRLMSRPPPPCDPRHQAPLPDPA
ncbi:AEC family transporter [Streptomyces sp. A3M-1-3]|uniref:AEC family transporter n=1 Tax=Streptomyces sp. A3M-1-3 TaxID=2962044 RepID=UPI0020B89FD9|nr:AEC family transporter [Streptomyces sp. A3M-1-3]MCP3818151.1 AEC family transporter [Streptomyces sp. A3M-1-3]